MMLSLLKILTNNQINANNGLQLIHILIFGAVRRYYV